MKSHYRKHILRASVAVLTVLLAACTTTNYDAGDGDNSRLTASLAMLLTASDATIHAAVLDNNTRVDFSNPFSIDWAQQPDTVYRALLYYDNPTSTSQTQGFTAKARSVVSVPVLSPMAASEVKQMHTDPVGFESLWLSKNGEYINISLLLKCGTPSGDNVRHQIGIVSNGTTTATDGQRTLRLTLFHDQGEMPEYYTVQQYVSIPTKTFGDADRVVLVVNTYEGVVERQISLLPIL